MTLGVLRCIFCLPHPFALQPGLEDGDILDLCRGGSERVFAQHHEIGAVSGGDAALGVFLEAGICACLGEAVEGFLEVEGLMGQVGGTAVQILPGHGALDAGEDIRGLHRAVRAVADGGTRVQQGLPGVTALCKLVTGTLMDDVDVVVQENGLGVDMELPLCDAPELVGPGDLAVDDAVAGISTGMGGLGLFDGIQHQIQAGIADAVDGHLHAVGMGRADQLVELRPGKDGEAPCAGFVGVGTAEEGGPCTQCAVAQELQRSHREPVGGRMVGADEFHQVGDGGKITLLPDPDGQRTLGLQLLVGLVHGLPGDLAEHAVIVAVTAGDAPAVQITAGGADVALEGLLVRGRDGIQHQIHRIVEEAAVFIVDLAAIGGGGAGGDAQHLHRFGVDRQGVTAGTDGADGQFGGYGVQIVAIGHPADIRETILIPAPSDDPSPVGGGIFQTLEHLGQGAGMCRQGCHVQGLAVVQQVHVAVIEPGADEGSVQIDALARKRQSFGADGGKSAILHGEGIGKIVARIDDGVVKNLHGHDRFLPGRWM